ncbi:MAG: hypothetical protein J2P25_22680 [Nocardiopsaceae bacterium]|nr:hypothetical protein [Nocardiopsaceae bacterium]
MIFSDITPGMFVLLGGTEPALVISKDRGGRTINGGLEPPRVQVKTRFLPAPFEHYGPGFLSPLWMFEPVTTDWEFIDSVAQVSGLIGLQARLISEWADALSAMSLPSSVVNPLYDTSDRLHGLSESVAHARQAFKEHFHEARVAAARGLRITGDGAA